MLKIYKQTQILNFFNGSNFSDSFELFILVSSVFHTISHGQRVLLKDVRIASDKFSCMKNQSSEGCPHINFVRHWDFFISLVLVIKKFILPFCLSKYANMFDYNETICLKKHEIHGICTKFSNSVCGGKIGFFENVQRNGTKKIIEIKIKYIQLRDYLFVFEHQKKVSVLMKR